MGKAEVPVEDVEIDPRRLQFDPRALAKEISDAINKNKKNKRERPVRCGSDSDNADITRYLSTGTSALDAPLGGGFACGRGHMIYGAPSAGKSLLLEGVTISAQLRGGIGFIIDSEHTFNKARFSAAGGHTSSLEFMEPKSLEEGFEYIEKTIKKLIAWPPLFGKPIVVGWDTINTNQTANKVKGNEYAAGMMEAPRVIWDGYRKICELIASSNVCFLVLNQVYGDKVPPGGKGLQFYSSHILYLEEEDTYFSYRTGKRGKLLKAEFRKTKSNPPPGDVVYFCCDSMGMDDAASIHYNLKPRGKGSTAVDHKVYKKNSSWFSYKMSNGEEVKWQGDKGFHKKTVEVEGFIDELAGELWRVWPPADPAVIEADEEFVTFYQKDNPWVEVGGGYTHCLISDHQCPVDIWKKCRASYWTECEFDLEDVEPIERIYHEPPAFEEYVVEDSEEEIDDE